jgi:hypothetical protein
MNVNAPAQPRSGTMDVDEFMAFLATQPDDRIELPEFGLACRVGDLYRGTPLDPQAQSR